MSERAQIVDAMTPVIWRALGGEGSGAAGPGVIKAARDLAKLYEQANNDKPLHVLLHRYNAAMHDIRESGEDPEAEDMNDRQFGRFLAMLALGMSRQAIAESMFVIPTFEVRLENDELVWEGDIAEVNPSKRTEYGFDLTEFEPGGFERVLRGLGICPPATVLHPQEGLRTFLWTGDGIEIVTAANPITGEAGSRFGRTEKNYASYMGIRGTKAKVEKAKRLIKEHATYIKGRGRGLDYVDFAGQPTANPAGQLTEPEDEVIDWWFVLRNLTSGEEVVVHMDHDDRLVYGHKAIEKMVPDPGSVLEYALVYAPSESVAKRAAGGPWPGRYSRVSGWRPVPEHWYPEDWVANPRGVLTAKGERMYEDIKAGYGSDPRAAEIAMRTVYARAADGVPGLVVRHGKPPGVPNRGR